MPKSVIESNWAAMGNSQISDLSSVQSLPHICGRAAVLQAEGENIRWRDDGVNPTDTVGVLLLDGQYIFYTGDLSKLRFIEEAASAKLNIAYYATPGKQVTPAPVPDPGPISIQSLEFEDNESITLGTTPIIEESQIYTFAWWEKAIAHNGITPESRFRFANDGGLDVIIIRDETTVSVGDQVFAPVGVDVLGTWIHYALVWKVNSVTSADYKLYVDGVEYAVDTTFLNPSLVGTQNVWGDNGNNPDVDCIFDDVRLYPYELSPSQIIALFNGSGFPTNMSHYWPIENNDVLDAVGSVNMDFNGGAEFVADAPAALS